MLAHFPVAHVVIRPEAAPADFPVRYAELREAIVAEYQPANQAWVRTTFTQDDGGFFAAPTQRAADLFAEYYALQQLEMRTDLHARIRTGLAFPVAIAVEAGLDAGARIVRTAGSPRDAIFITDRTTNATLAVAMSALVAARDTHGGIPLDDWSMDIAPVEASEPPAEFDEVIARARSLSPRRVRGIEQPCMRILLSGKRIAGDGADSRYEWHVRDM